MSPAFTATSPCKQTVFDVVVAATKRTFGFTQEQLLGRSRTQSLAWARQIAMTALREQFGLSSPEVAALFQRDHGTVLHAEQTVRQATGSAAQTDIKRFLSTLAAMRRQPAAA